MGKKFFSPLLAYQQGGNVSFPHEAIRGSDFFSAQVATSDSEMHQRVLRKSQTQELPHVEKAFSNVAINKLVNLKIT